MCFTCPAWFSPNYVCTGKDESHATVATYAGDEGRSVFRAELSDGRKSLEEDGGHFRPRQIASRGEDEGTDSCAQQCGGFNCAITDARVLRDHHPAASADLRQPCLVRGILREEVVMDARVLACPAKRLGDDSPAKGTVNKEDLSLRRRWRVRIGRLLRRSHACIRSLQPVSQWNCRPGSVPPRRSQRCVRYSTAALCREGASGVSERSRCSRIWRPPAHGASAGKAHFRT